MSLHSFIVDSGGDHFGLETPESATRVNSQKVLDFTVADGLCGGPGMRRMAINMARALDTWLRTALRPKDHRNQRSLYREVGGPGVGGVCEEFMGAMYCTENSIMR
jgi:hypothetical protein